MIGGIPKQLSNFYITNLAHMIVKITVYGERSHPQDEPDYTRTNVFNLYKISSVNYDGDNLVEIDQIIYNFDSKYLAKTFFDTVCFYWRKHKLIGTTLEVPQRFAEED